MKRLQKAAEGTKPTFKEFMEENNQARVDDYCREHGLHPDDDRHEAEWGLYENEYVPKFGEDLEYENSEV